MMLIEPRIKIHNDYVRESSINAELEGRLADAPLRPSFFLSPTVLISYHSPSLVLLLNTKAART